MQLYDFSEGGVLNSYVSIIGGLSINDNNRYLVLLALIPIIGFSILDAFYLKTERKYRYYYEYVAQKNESDIDFSLNPGSFRKSQEQEKKLKFIRCFFSHSIMTFYIAITIALGIVCVLLILTVTNTPPDMLAQ